MVAKSQTQLSESAHTHTHTHTADTNTILGILFVMEAPLKPCGVGGGGGTQSKQESTLALLCVLAVSFLWQEDPPHRCSCCHGKGHSAQGDRNWAESK